MNYDIIYLFIIQNYLLKVALYFQENCLAWFPGPSQGARGPD